MGSQMISQATNCALANAMKYESLFGNSNSPKQRMTLQKPVKLSMGKRAHTLLCPCAHQIAKQSLSEYQPKYFANPTRVSPSSGLQYNQSLGKCKPKPQLDYHFTPTRVATDKKRTACVGEDIEKSERSCTVSRNVKCCSNLGKQSGSSSKG